MHSSLKKEESLFRLHFKKNHQASFFQGLRELLEISQRSLSTPVQRPKRPAPTIHKEVTPGVPLILKRIDTQGPRVGYTVEYQVQTEAVADEIEVVTLPRPGAARTAIVKSLPKSLLGYLLFRSSSSRRTR